LEIYGGGASFGLGLAVWFLSYVLFLTLLKTPSQSQRRGLALGCLMMGLLVGHYVGLNDSKSQPTYEPPPEQIEQTEQTPQPTSQVSTFWRLIIAILVGAATYAIGRAWLAPILMFSFPAHAALVGLCLVMALLGFYLSGFLTIPALLSLLLLITLGAYGLKTRFGPI
jgi:hypothetical protein